MRPLLLIMVLVGCSSGAISTSPSSTAPTGPAVIHGPYTSADAASYAHGTAFSEAHQRATLPRDRFTKMDANGETLSEWQHLNLQRTTGCIAQTDAVYIGHGGGRQARTWLARISRRDERNLPDGAAVVNEQTPMTLTDQRADVGTGLAIRVIVVALVECPTEPIGG